jgi:hypothetical protein
MVIKQITVTNYKNLKNCKISPKGLFALTGCNSSGKSNFIEIFQFITIFLWGSEEARGMLLGSGLIPNSGTSWRPDKGLDNGNFEFCLECKFPIKGVEWELNYSVEIIPASRETAEPTSAQIFSEKLYAKEVGKPGRATEVISRNIVGDTVACRIEEKRNEDKFKTKSDMSALQSLEVREADAFPERYPLLFEFKKGLASSNLLLINPRRLMSNTFFRKYHKYPNSPGEIIDDFPIYEFLVDIKNSDKYDEFKYWLKLLCSIDDITLHEQTVDGQPQDKKEKYTFIFINQFGRTLLPHGLSTGCAMILGILIAIYSFLKENGFILLEEPEIYLHPRAIIELIRLFREVSKTKTVFFTTHSPVVLNSMKPDEVALMVPTENFNSTTKVVSEINEATTALNSGFMSFGDLLQTNFNYPTNK